MQDIVTVVTNMIMAATSGQGPKARSQKPIVSPPTLSKTFHHPRHEFRVPQAHGNRGLGDLQVTKVTVSLRLGTPSLTAWRMEHALRRAYCWPMSARALAPEVSAPHGASSLHLALRASRSLTIASRCPALSSGWLGRPRIGTIAFPGAQPRRPAWADRAEPAAIAAIWHLRLC